MSVTELELTPLEELRIRRREQAVPNIGAKLLDHHRYVGFLEARVVILEGSLKDFLYASCDADRELALKKLVELARDGNLRA